MIDLAIIGGGPGGYVAAERAGAKGLNVVLFEKRELGGVCLNEGCIPTKTLLYSAKVYDYAKHGDKYGVSAPGATFDFGKIVERKNKVVKKLVGGVGSAMKANKVRVVRGEAKVHGGVIGMEFASFFNSLGTEVTVVEMLPKILGGLDGEISAMLQDIYAKKGIKFNLNCKVTEIRGNEVVYVDKDGQTLSAKGDKILMSVGRRAVTAGLGLENLGIEMNRGAVKVDDKMRTNAPNVFAAGDITGFSMLAHTASREGEVVVNNLTGRADRMRYNAIPGVVYTNPEVAGVGLTEEQAKAEGIECKIAKLPMAYAGRFVAENEGGAGLCKVIVGAKYGEVLGVHMLGNPCSEIIYGACMAIEQEMTLKEMQEVVFPHPTVSEIFKETVFSFNE